MCTDADAWIYVADRENQRVQVFDDKANRRRRGTICTGHAGYVGEVLWTQWPKFHPDTPRPAYIRSLQKYERVH